MSLMITLISLRKIWFKEQSIYSKTTIFFQFREYLRCFLIMESPYSLKKLKTCYIFLAVPLLK